MTTEKDKIIEELLIKENVKSWGVGIALVRGILDKALQSQNQKIIEEIEKRIKMYHDKLRGSKFEGASNKRWHILKKELRNLLKTLGEKEQ